MWILFFLLRVSCFLAVYLVAGSLIFPNTFSLVDNLPFGALTAVVLALIIRRESLLGRREE